MTYQTGNKILAGDYNTFIRGGATSGNPNVPNVNTIWGIGFGSRGYGQTSILPTVNTNSIVTATHWNNLIDRINAMRLHQLGEAGWLIIPRDPDPGEQIAIVSRIPQSVTDLYNDRMLSARNAADLTYTPLLQGPEYRPYMWNAEANGQITITATWADPEQVRYFFNAGGKLRLTLNATYHASTLRAVEWADIINKLGTVEINSVGSIRRGGGGGTLIENSNIGYYDLQSVNQTLVRIGPSPITYGSQVYGGYGADDTMTVRVRSNGTQGTRNDMGTVITFSIDFEDASYTTPFDMNLQIMPTFVVRPPSNIRLPTPIANPTVVFDTTFEYTPVGYMY